MATNDDSTPRSIQALATDLIAERTAIRTIVDPLPPHLWSTPTPASGWTVLDQVTHLAYFDDRASEAASDVAAFARDVTRFLQDPDSAADRIAAECRHLSGAEALTWLDSAQDRLVKVMAPLDPKARLPWYGPSMSVASCVTARIMETWAHGQDIADALGVTREPTSRLRHIAHIGVATMGFSLTNSGFPAPDQPVRVELAGPGDASWTWGPNDAANRVSGDALDFALVVTQRRHLDDTDLKIEGLLAEQWMSVAQAFAGPPGNGRTRHEEGQYDG